MERRAWLVSGICGAKCGPNLVHRVSPAYAAQTIEKNNPSLKNSLLNLLLLGRNRDAISDSVYQTLQQQAAQRLSHVPKESAVDQSGLVRVTAIFAAAVVALVIYKAASPKDPFVTAQRVLMPWAEIAAPSRVSIEDVEPGTTSITRGGTLEVSAMIRGLKDDGTGRPEIYHRRSAGGLEADFDEFI